MSARNRLVEDNTHTKHAGAWCKHCLLFTQRGDLINRNGGQAHAATPEGWRGGMNGGVSAVISRSISLYVVLLS